MKSLFFIPFLFAGLIVACLQTEFSFSNSNFVAVSNAVANTGPSYTLTVPINLCTNTSSGSACPAYTIQQGLTSILGAEINGTTIPATQWQGPCAFTYYCYADGLAMLAVLQEIFAHLDIISTVTGVPVDSISYAAMVNPLSDTMAVIKDFTITLPEGYFLSPNNKVIVRPRWSYEVPASVSSIGGSFQASQIINMGNTNLWLYAEETPTINYSWTLN